MEKRKQCYGKKGSIQDFALIIVSFVAVALAVLICFNLIETIGGALRGSGKMPTESVEAMQSVTNLYPGVLDNVFFIGAAPHYTEFVFDYVEERIKKF